MYSGYTVLIFFILLFLIIFIHRYRRFCSIFKETLFIYVENQSYGEKKKVRGMRKEDVSSIYGDTLLLASKIPCNIGDCPDWVNLKS